MHQETAKRFGQENKLLQMIGTKPMYRYGLDRLIDLCKDHEGFEIIVVTQYQEIMKQTQYDPITTVFCPEVNMGFMVDQSRDQSSERCRILYIFRSRPAQYEKRDNRKISLFYGR